MYFAKDSTEDYLNNKKLMGKRIQMIVTYYSRYKKITISKL